METNLCDTASYHAGRRRPFVGHANFCGMPVQYWLSSIAQPASNWFVLHWFIFSKVAVGCYWPAFTHGHRLY